MRLADAAPASSARVAPTLPADLPNPLTAILAALAEQIPEEPWLFHRGWISWEWRSFAQVADQVARGVQLLQASQQNPHQDRSDRAQSRQVAFDSRCHPDQVAIDLAIQAAGLTSVAVGPDLLLPAWEPQPACWMDSEGVPADPARLALRLPAPSSWLKPRPLTALDPSAGAAGAVLVQAEVPAANQNPEVPAANLNPEVPAANLNPEVPAAKPGTRQLSQRQLRAAAGQLDAQLAGIAGPGEPERWIVFSSVPLTLFAGRVLTAWTLERRAAWVLEPQRDALVAGALWARPHLVVGYSAELSGLAQALTGVKARHRRLKCVWAVDDDLEAARLDLWQQLGVQASRFPRLVTA